MGSYWHSDTPKQSCKILNILICQSKLLGLISNKYGFDFNHTFQWLGISFQTACWLKTPSLVPNNCERNNQVSSCLFDGLIHDYLLHEYSNIITYLNHNIKQILNKMLFGMFPFVSLNPYTTRIIMLLLNTY